jgi:hypothetical protein
MEIRFRQPVSDISPVVSYESLSRRNESSSRRLRVPLLGYVERMTDHNIPADDDISDDDIDTEGPTEQDEDLDQGGEGSQDTGDEA